MTEDVEFYVDEALAVGRARRRARRSGRAGSPSPIAKAGVRGDRRRRVAGHARRGARVRRARGRRAGCIDLRVGDLRDAAGRRARARSSTSRSARCCTCRRGGEARARSRRRAACSSPTAASSSTSSLRAAEDIEETDGLLARARARDLRARRLGRALAHAARSRSAAASRRRRWQLHWLSPPEWHALLERAGFGVEALYGWFDRRPWDGGEDRSGSAAAPELTS